MSKSDIKQKQLQKLLRSKKTNMVRVAYHSLGKYFSVSLKHTKTLFVSEIRFLPILLFLLFTALSINFYMQTQSIKYDSAH